MMFDCGHAGDSGVLCKRGCICILCFLNPLAIAAVKIHRHARGETARLIRRAFDSIKEKLQDAPDEKVMRIARRMVKNQYRAEANAYGSQVAGAL